MHWNTKYIITSFVESSVQASSRQCSIKMTGSYGKFGKPDVLVEWKASFISNSLSVLFPFFTSLSLLPVPRLSNFPLRCSVKCFQCRTSIGVRAVFFQGGAVNHLPKKFLQVAQIFTKQSNRNEGRCNNIGRTGIWKWLHTVFQGQYLPNSSINYVAINKQLEKLPTSYIY